MNRRALFPLMAMVACFGLILTSAFGDDPLGRGKKGGGTTGGSGSSGGSGGQRQDPPKREDPPRRQDPPQRQDPPRREDPPRRQDPPQRQDPPRREDPPQRQDPPRRDDPLNRGGGRGDGNRGGSQGGNSGSGQSGNQGSGDVPIRGGSGQNRDNRSDRIKIFNPTPGQEDKVRDELLGKKSGSKSGNVQYGSNSNERRQGRGNPVNIDRAPIDIRRGSLENMVRRSDEIRINGTRIRIGYSHYDSRWRDDYFYYPHYVFDPFRSDFVCSPFYYYAQLPAYFNYNRCYFPTNYVWSPFSGVRYRWNQPSRDYWNRDYNELDYVVEDIVNVFMDSDRRAIGRLIPRNGQVGIIMEGQFAYALRSDDFYDTLVDASENTRTVDYRILDVQYRRDAASVYARHDYEDPWGRRVSVYHYFKVETEGRNWVIREFGTSNSRW